MATATYSLKDVSGHKDANSAWIVVNGGVYDVTSFLVDHPGGEEVLLEQAGGDATEAFEDVGHSSDARDMMVQHKIGDLCEEDRVKINAKPDRWATAPPEDDSSSSWTSWVMPVMLGLLFTVVYRYFFSGSPNA